MGPPPPDTLPDGEDTDALWRDWDRIVQAADPRFECWYAHHRFRVRAVRDRPWPLEMNEDRSLRLLLALHRSRLRGETSCAATRLGADASLAESTAYQALGGLAEGVGKRTYRLALEPGREIWLTPAHGPSRLTTLAAEATRRPLGGEETLSGGEGTIEEASLGEGGGGAPASHLVAAGPVDVAGLLGVVEEQITYHAAQQEYHEVQGAHSAAMLGRLSAQRERLRALPDPPPGQRTRASRRMTAAGTGSDLFRTCPPNEASPPTRALAGGRLSARLWGCLRGTVGVPTGNCGGAYGE